MTTLDPEHTWYRVADPAWSDPLDPTFAQRHGGRWNPPDSWPTLYLNRDVPTARAQIERLLVGTPINPDDLTADAFVLIAVRLPGSSAEQVVDVVTAAGVEAAGLPASFPVHPNGRPVSHRRCHLVAEAAFALGADGIESRSAATRRREPPMIELAWWPRGRSPRQVGQAIPYGHWRSG